ncbi:MAG TPA: hypothetical protein VJ378_01110 [Candidatus Paceibacterota bacterium]|nr:hypothetical protein [Candidatus Paceibacterota bacterium]
MKNKKEQTIRRCKNIGIIFICLGTAIILIILTALWAVHNEWIMQKWVTEINTIMAIIFSIGLVMTIIGFIFHAIASEMMVQKIFKKWEKRH